MSNKGNNRHVKRLASSRYIKVQRKTSKYVSKQHPGRYTYETSIALITVLKEKAMVVENTAEASSALKRGAIKVNGKIVKDPRYPVGFGDIIRVEHANENYKIDVEKKGAVKVVKTGSNAERVLKVTGKYLAKGDKVMLRLYDGTTISGKSDIKVNDSVLLDGNKVSSVIKMEQGAKCFVINGAHASESGTIKEIKQGSATRDATVTIESGSSTFDTLLDNIMVLGK
jgi:small subunit ribosomal protein S4e